MKEHEEGGTNEKLVGISARFAKSWPVQVLLLLLVATGPTTGQETAPADLAPVPVESSQAEDREVIPIELTEEPAATEAASDPSVRPAKLSSDGVADESGDLVFYANAIERMRVKADGSVGIGTSAPTDKLQVNGDTSIEGRLTFTNGMGHVFHVPSVGGGQFTHTGDITGYIKITLPRSWSNTMMRMHVDIFDYIPGKSRTVTVGGYNATNGWSRTFASQLSNDETPIRVHYGHDGTACAIYLSKGTEGAATLWRYPKVLVRDFLGGHSMAAATNWSDGWSVSVTPTLGTISVSALAPPTLGGAGTIGWIPRYTHAFVLGNGAMYDNGAGRIGLGTTDPLAALHAKGPSAQFLRVESSDPNENAGITMANDARVWMTYVSGDDGDKFHIRDSTHGTNRLTVDTAGRVGIGTNSPAVALQVVGDTAFSGTVTGGNIKAKFQDIAEWVPSTTDLAPATVVVLDLSTSNRVMPASTPYDTTVAGVVSAQPGLSLGEEGSGMEQIATMGRVRVRVDARRLPIRVGDLLVTSDVPGTAMRSEPFEVAGRTIHQPGTIIGKALEPLTDGLGEILVLLSMQ